MGFFDFLKKKQQEEIKKEVIRFENIDEWITNKEKDILEKDQALVLQIKQRTLLLINELGVKTGVLEKIDVREKKVEDRVKFIVKENLDKYIILLRRLIPNLKEIKFNNSYDTTARINSLIYEFEKRSAMNYEKATFLIGRELEDVKKAISNYFKDIKELLKDNKYSDQTQLLIKIETKLKDLEELEKIKREIESTISGNEEKMINLEGWIDSKKESIKNMRESEDYKNELEKEEYFETKKQDIEKEIFALKDIIEIKQLANKLHSNSKMMILVNEFNSNFIRAFQRDNGASLIALLEEAGMNNSFALKKINELVHDLKNFNTDSKEVSKKERQRISTQEEEIKKMRLEIDYLQGENSKERKRHEKILENKSEIINSIKNELEKMNVEVI